MRTGKDVDYTQVDFITYAFNEYIKDIPIQKVVEHYIKLESFDEESAIGYIHKASGAYKVKCFYNSYFCLIDEQPYNAEQFIIFLEGEEIDPVPIIYELTGVDQDEYISEVTYKDGTTELLEVKGKCLLIGHQ